jgi:hypothetical protein
MKFQSGTVHKIRIVLTDEAEQFEFAPTAYSIARATELVVAGYTNPEGSMYPGIHVYVHKIIGEALKKDGTPANRGPIHATYSHMTGPRIPAMPDPVIEAVERAKERLRLNLHRDAVQINKLNETVTA